MVVIVEVFIDGEFKTLRVKKTRMGPETKTFSG